MTSPSRPLIDIEAELSIAVSDMGGCRVDAIVGKKPGFKNADFFFEKLGVIAELKVLTKDQISDPVTIKKMSELYKKVLTAGQAPVVVFGRRRISTERFPAWVAEEVAKIYAVPIRRVIRDACDQIRLTKQHLNRPGFSGALLLVNDGNSALDPAHIDWTLSHILGGAEFPEIQQVIFFTVNMQQTIGTAPASGALQPEAVCCWVPRSRRILGAVNPKFELELRQSWFKRMSILTGSVAEFDADSLPIAALKNADFGNQK